MPKNSQKKTPKKSQKNKSQKNNSQKNNSKKQISKKSEKKHIFGKVYAEWCGACKQLQPNWVEMLTKLNGNKWDEYSPQEKEQEMKKTIMVNKDGTVLEIIQIQDSDYENYKSQHSDLRDLEANGYPTIFRKKMHIPNSPIEYYNGNRSPDDLIDWALDRTRKEELESPFVHFNNGGKKRVKSHKKQKKHSFSQKISNFWGWK